MGRLLIMLLLVPILSCHSQPFSMVRAEKWNFKKVQISQDAYFVDGEVFKKGDDHTSLLQGILNKHQLVVLPSKQLNINYGGVSLRSNSQLYFQENSSLKMIANDKGTYAVLKIRGVSNVKLHNPQLIGDRNEHKGNSGEWGMGIDIRSSTNIIINNPYIKDMWGDGIYFGIQNSGKVNENILIEGGIIDYSRRNGVSVTSGKNIRLNNISLYNTYGTKPMAAICIEPNKNSVVVSEVTLDNIKTINSGFSGVTIALSHLRHTKHKVSNVTVKNHYDRGSVHALRVGPVSTPKATGNIQILDANWGENSDSPFVFSDITKTSLKVDVKNSYLNDNHVNEETAIKNVKGEVNNRLQKNFSFK